MRRRPIRLLRAAALATQAWNVLPPTGLGGGIVFSKFVLSDALVEASAA